MLEFVCHQSMRCVFVVSVCLSLCVVYMRGTYVCGGKCFQACVSLCLWVGCKSGCMPFAGLYMTVSLCVSVWYISVPGCVLGAIGRLSSSGCLCVCDTIWCVSVGGCGPGCFIYTYLDKGRRLVCCACLQICTCDIVIIVFGGLFELMFSRQPPTG